MSLKIRMSRGGTKKRPYYSIVIAESRSPRDGRFIEQVGTYNPLLKKDDPNRVILKQDRIAHWLKMGATPSDRVQFFLHRVGMAEKPVHRAQTKKHLPKAKTQERMKVAAEAAAAAAAAPAAAPAPAEGGEAAAQ